MKRHFENLTNKVGRTVKHWWMLFIAGILCLAAGVTVFVFPLESYVTLSIIFGILMVLVVPFNSLWHLRAITTSQ